MIAHRMKNPLVANISSPTGDFDKGSNHKIILSNKSNRAGKIVIADAVKIGGGAFVGTDLWDNPFATPEDRKWAQNILKYKWRNNYGAVTGQIKAVASPFPSVQGN